MRHLLAAGVPSERTSKCLNCICEESAIFCRIFGIVRAGENQLHGAVRQRNRLRRHCSKIPNLRVAEWERRDSNVGRYYYRPPSPVLKKRAKRSERSGTGGAVIK